MTQVADRAARWCALLLILVCCIGCDQVTKDVALTHLKGQAPQTYCGGIVRLEYAENPGAFLSLGAQLSPTTRLIVLTAGNGLLMSMIAVMLALRWNTISIGHLLSFSMLLSGGIGNLIDRLRFGGLVIDFLTLGIGPLRTGIFNVADVAISVGAILLLVAGYKAGAAAPGIEQA